MSDHVEEFKDNTLESIPAQDDGGTHVSDPTFSQDPNTTPDDPTLGLVVDKELGSMLDQIPGKFPLVPTLDRNHIVSLMLQPMGLRGGAATMGPSGSVCVSSER